MDVSIIIINYNTCDMTAACIDSIFKYTKGISFDDFTQNDINLMLNHINSVKRDSLEGDNPYTLMKEFLPQKIIDLFEIKEINQKDIILKDKLFYNKNKR